MNLKEALKGKLNHKELDMLHRSFDTIGSIAIIDIPNELKKKEKVIASTLLEKHKNLKSAYKKAGKVSGRLRTRKLKWLAGEKSKETEHRESGCRFKLDVETCYFSPRLSNDRLDIAKQVKSGEKVLALFSGVGPYPIVIAKNSRAKEVYAVELNRKASKYAEENVRLNKLKNVHVIQGDVKRIIPKLVKKVGKFDRIVMARPNLKETFLKEAFAAAKDGTVVNYHDFLPEEEIPDSTLKKLEESASKIKNHPNHYRLLRWKYAGDIGPGKYRVRVDFMVF